MESFILYTSQYKSIQSLSKSDKGELLDALYAFAETDGAVPLHFTHPQTEMAFSFISSRIDENNDKYLKLCEKRRAAGRKGGRPKKDSDTTASAEEEKAKKANGFSKKAKKQKKLADTDTESSSISYTDTASDTLCSKVADAATLQKKQKKARGEKTSGSKQLPSDDGQQSAEKWEKWFLQVIGIFNHAVSQNDSAIRPVRTISDSRRQALQLLYSKYHYTADQFRQAFANIARSNYCNGRTPSRHRPVDFDWLIREENFNRAYEGSL